MNFNVIIDKTEQIAQDIFFLEVEIRKNLTEGSARPIC